MPKRKEYHWELPIKIENRLGVTSYGRQRAIFEGADLLIILHDLPKPDQLNREAYVFWRQNDGALLCNGEAEGEIMLRKLLQRYLDRFTALDERYEESEDPKAYFAILEEAIPISRAAANLSKTLQSARDKVKADPLLLEMRDMAVDVQRHYELLLADLKNALDYNIAKNAERQAIKAEEAVEAQHRLNILVAVFFPLISVATIFGMNLVNGLENRSPMLFWLVFAFGLVIGLILMKWVLKKKG